MNEGSTRIYSMGAGMSGFFIEACESEAPFYRVRFNPECIVRRREAGAGASILTLADGAALRVNLALDSLEELLCRRDVRAGPMIDLKPFTGENQWPQEERLAQAARRNCREEGAAMPDGTIYAGVSSETGRKFFAAPRDKILQLSFNAAAKCAQKMNEEKYLGHDDWRVPTRAELKLLYDNRQKGALAGTFQEVYGQSGRSSFYWSSTPYFNSSAYGRWFDDGLENKVSKVDKYSVRVVRSPQEPPV